MSNPNEIDQFNANIKRTSDRIRGNSASPSTQLGDPAAENNGGPADQPTNSTTAGAGSQARKGQKGKKPTGPTNNVPPSIQAGPAPPAEDQQSTDDSTAGHSNKEQSALGGPQLGTQSSTAPPAPAPPTANPATGAPPPASSVQLIAPEVINKTSVGNTAPPVSASQAAQAKFLAGTSTILNRIDECSPDAIKDWLQSRGFSLVPTATGPTEAEVVKNSEFNQLSDRGPVTQNPPAAALPSVTQTATPRPASVQSTAAAQVPEQASANPAPPAKVVAPSVAAGRKRAAPDEIFDLTAEDDSTSVDKAVTAASTIKFSEEGIEAHGLVSLSKYFGSKMKTLDAYIPLSVFNPQWLRQDLLQQTIRPKSVKEKLENSYVGLPVPLEWKMTFGEWVVAFDLFVAYLEHYKWETLATKFKTHKDNVLAIKRENANWPVAFRYDLAVRTAVLTFRLPDGSVANPAIRDDRLEREAMRETERLKDFLPAYKETNPYADGEPKAFIDPISGIDSRTSTASSSSGFNKPSYRSQSFSNQQSFTSLPVYDGPGGSSPNNFDEIRSRSRNNRHRGRRGSWNGNQGSRDRSPQRRRFNGKNESWRREDRRDERGGEDRDNAGPAGMAK